MKLTAIKAQVKNPQRVSLFLDEQYAFSLSLDELVKFRLKQNDEFSEAELKKFKKISADGKLRARALEWLINRPHSEREFRDYLYRKKADPDQIESLVNEFTKRGYLDNAKFAAWFVELQARRGKSDRAIRSELFAKGVSRELADEVLEQSQNDEPERLRLVIDKKIRLARYQKDPVKLAKYLTSQGFSYQLVKEQLKINVPN